MTSDRRLLFLLQHAARAAIGRTNARLARDLEVTAMQLGTLSFVSDNPDCAPGEIAALFDLNKSAVTTMLRRLERGGLIARTANPRDGRGQQLRITERGEAMRQAAGPAFRDAMAEMTKGFTAAEMDIVLRFLNEVVARRGASDGSGPASCKEVSP